MADTEVAADAAASFVRVTFKAQVTIPMELVSHALSAGLDGDVGISYWGHTSRKGKPTVWLFTSDPERTATSGQHWGFDYPLNPGGCLYIVDDLSDDDGVLTLDSAAVQKGLTVLAEKYPWHLADIMADNADATTGDVLVQCALLGDIEYS